jgi:glycosyltransferase involved in cell wall biosynthesis
MMKHMPMKKYAEKPPSKRKLLYVMNIPSPYRWFLFSKLYKLGKERNIEFRVLFLAKGSKKRTWHLSEFSNRFPYTVAWGINFSLSDVRMLNPFMIVKLLFQRWDWIIFGGYDNPTNAILLTLPMPKTRRKVIRNEGNLHAPGIVKGAVAGIKRFLLGRCDAYLIPGLRGQEWLDYWQPARRDKPTHVFPNVIDDLNFRRSVNECRKNKQILEKKYGIDTQKRIFFCAARLSPEKGLIEFIRCLPESFAGNNDFLIAGDGPLRDQLLQLIEHRGLSRSVRLLGYIHHSQIPEIYAISDIFVLPSFRDHNPLSVIEASFAGLPLILSKRIGNYPEVIVEDISGWGFDPDIRKEMVAAIHKAMAIKTEDLRIMGSNSLKKAEQYFQSDTACHRLIDFLLTTVPA